MLCMGNCIHRLKVSDINNNQIDIRYCNKDQIKEIYNQTSQNIPQHIVDLENERYESDEENDNDENDSDKDKSFSLVKIVRERGKRPVKTIIMNGIDEQKFIDGMIQYVLYILREDKYGCADEWIEWKAFFDDHLPILTKSVQNMIKYAKKYDDDICILDDLGYGYSYELVVQYKNIELDDELLPEIINNKFKPEQSIAKKMWTDEAKSVHAVPRRWYTEKMLEENRSFEKSKIVVLSKEEADKLNDRDLWIYTADKLFNFHSHISFA
jgi:hypothetical protein